MNLTTVNHSRIIFGNKKCFVGNAFCLDQKDKTNDDFQMDIGAQTNIKFKGRMNSNGKSQVFGVGKCFICEKDFRTVLNMSFSAHFHEPENASESHISMNRKVIAR